MTLLAFAFIVLMLSGLIVWVIWPDSGTLVGQVVRNDISGVERSLFFGADINGYSMWGWRGDIKGSTPLTAAVKHADDSTVVILLERGADPIQRDGVGIPPICWAAILGRLDVAKTLVNHGADVELPEVDGDCRAKKSAMDHARSQGYMELLEFLDSQRDQPELVRLEIDVPEESLTHWHRAYRKPEFEVEPEPEMAPWTMVPKGAKNIALGKKVTSGGDQSFVGHLKYITDGIKSASENDVVEFLDGARWVQIDLEYPCPIYAIWICRGWMPMAPENDIVSDVIVQLSNDPEFLKGVVTVFNNDHDNSSNLGQGDDAAYNLTRYGKLVNCPGVSARYVRLYCNGTLVQEHRNSYVEVEVYGVDR